jgi:predicted N-acetyltransferase YhbS
MQKEAQEVEIRQLNESDLPAAMRLKELARWNQTEKDWRRLLRLEPQGCFAACFEERVVATTTTTTYDKTLAWIGMVIVDPAFRRRGIAARLMRTALASLQRAGVATVKLDATPDGRYVYEELGFVGESLIERWEGVAQPPAQATPEGATLTERAWPALLALDRRAFGADRARVLEYLKRDSCAQPLMSSAPDGSLRGYVLARHGSAASYLGPLVATDEQTALSLFDGMLAQLIGQRVYLDFNRDSVASDTALAERGFSKQRELIRMSFGQKNSAGTSEPVVAIAGPEVG